MVIIKANKAIGSVLGQGTHTWLEIWYKGEKITYSGAKGPNKILEILKNYKRDYDRDAGHGMLTVPPPKDLNEEQWAEKVIAAAEKALEEMHHQYHFCGMFPWGKNKGIRRANCCSYINKVIKYAGGEIPKGHFKGFTPGLR